MATVILGSGIIGVSTAYYLSETQAPSSIHLVEPSPTLFASASAKAGGFLAKDWRLAEKYDGREKWGYSASTSSSYTAGKGQSLTGTRGDDWLRHDTSRAEAAASESVSTSAAADKGHGLDFLTRREGDEIEIICDQSSTAQVDPLRLCHFLLTQCLERGVQLHHPARASSLRTDAPQSNEVSSIRILDGESGAETDVACARLLISAGAWSPQVFAALFPAAPLSLPVSALAGYSLMVRSPRLDPAVHEELGCQAIFTTDAEAGFAPELFTRVGGDIYVAGLNDASLSLPRLPMEAVVDAGAVEKLRMTSRRLLGLPGRGGSDDDDDDLEVVRTALCFRPVTSRGTPILARIPDSKLGGVKTEGNKGDGGVFLAAGHGPWGISHSLGTGKVMAEMIQGLRTSANVEALGL